HLSELLVTVPLFLYSAPPTPDTDTLSLHDALPISTASAPNSSAPAIRPASGSSAKNGTRLGATKVRDSTTPATSGRTSTNTAVQDRKSTRLNSSHVKISYAVFCLKKKNNRITIHRR